MKLDEIKERLEAPESIQAGNLESIMVYNPDFEDQDEYEEETGSLLDGNSSNSS